MTPRDLLDLRSDLMKLLIRPCKHRYRTGPSKPKLEWLCKLLSVPCGRTWTGRGKCQHCMDAGIHPPKHLCLLLLQSSSLQNPMFCRLPPELKFFILFVFIFVLPSPLISLYSNLENYVFAQPCQLCSRFCQDEWLQLFKSVKTWMMGLQYKNEDHKDTSNPVTPC